MAFRMGKVVLIDGTVRFTDGLEAKVFLHRSSKVSYTFREGRWAVDGIAVVVGGGAGFGGRR